MGQHYYNPNEFRLSSSAFMWGRLVYTDYNTGCLRKILLQSRDISPSIQSKYETLGDINEARHTARLVESGVTFQAEVPIKRKSQKVPEISVSGHADFVIDTVGVLSVDELKSVSSKNVRREVIGKGLFKTENLAQCVAYMGEVEAEYGRLIYTYYEPVERDGKTDLVQVDERIFVVAVDEYARICVNDKPTQFTYYDVVAHRNAAINVIATGKVAERPYRHDAVFNSPCRLCAFNGVCERYDNGFIGSDDAFVTESKQVLNRETDDDE